MITNISVSILFINFISSSKSEETLTGPVGRLMELLYPNDVSPVISQLQPGYYITIYIFIIYRIIQIDVTL